MKVLRDCEMCNTKIIEESPGKLTIKHPYHDPLCEECIKVLENYNPNS